jgi:acyl-coenzyme A thioesterase PaaI-like protein
MKERLLKFAIDRAKSGRPWLFSRIMQEVIPFNRVHRISVTQLSSQGCEAYLPFRRRNLNHLGTMHATAIATAAEYVAGLNVIDAFDISKYRLIMGRLEVDYVRRAEGACTTKSAFEHGQLDKLRSELKAEGVSKFTLQSQVIDSVGETIAVATVHWQVKSWDKVRVK